MKTAFYASAEVNMGCDIQKISNIMVKLASQALDHLPCMSQRLSNHLRIVRLLLPNAHISLYSGFDGYKELTNDTSNREGQGPGL